jgi:hypothetical protein
VLELELLEDELELVVVVELVDELVLVELLELDVVVVD